MTKLNTTDMDGSFLSGNKYQSIDQERHAIMNKVMTAINDKESTDVVSLTPREVETAINVLANNLLHFAESEWGNDYFDCLHSLAAIEKWLTEQGVFKQI